MTYNGGWLLAATKGFKTGRGKNDISGSHKIASAWLRAPTCYYDMKVSLRNRVVPYTDHCCVRASNRALYSASDGLGCRPHTDRTDRGLLRFCPSKAKKPVQNYRKV